jgi:hypothetical protein
VRRLGSYPLYRCEHTLRVIDGRELEKVGSDGPCVLDVKSLPSHLSEMWTFVAINAVVQEWLGIVQGGAGSGPSPSPSPSPTTKPASPAPTVQPVLIPVTLAKASPPPPPKVVPVVVPVQQVRK